MVDYLKNGFNWVHLCGGIIGFQNSYLLFDDLVYKIFFIWFLDVLKEIGDGVAKKYNVKWMFKIGFDPKGFDGRDTLMCALGIVIGILLTKIGGWYGF